MSVSREEAIKNIKSVKHHYTNFLRTNVRGLQITQQLDVIENFINQSPQLSERAKKWKNYVENSEKEIVELSDDVEKAMKLINKWYEDCAYETITKGKAIEYENKLTQHIQALTNENSELKEENERLLHDTMALNRINKAQANENERLKEAIEASQTNAQSLGEWTLQQWDKLNKISAIMDSAYKQSENGMNFDSTYYFNQILKVLEEETHETKNSD